MARAVPVAGGDARLGGGLGLGSLSGLEKPDKRSEGTEKGERGREREALPRGGGHGLGSGGKEKPSGPRTGTAAGGKLPRGGGHGLGSGGKEKPETPSGGPAHGHYADPGYQADGKARFPTHTEAHTRASMRAFNKAKGNYKQGDQTTIGRKLALAAKRHGIDPYENAMRK